MLAERGVRLVYGGGAVGLMGAVADAVLDGGGEVIGVIPTGLFSREVGHRSLTELIEVESMHQRKQLMFELADAFVALPGGIGTLEELAEITTWSQLGVHDKPIAVVDVAGYWRPILDFLDHAVDQRFLAAPQRSLVACVASVDELFDALDRYAPVPVDKWLDADET